MRRRAKDKKEVTRKYNTRSALLDQLGEFKHQSKAATEQKVLG